jgi:putative ABC transport system permease protein
MEFLPILSTLRRHKITAFLVVLEIALTCAIVCNAVFLIDQRLDRMDMQSGVAEHELVQIQMANIGTEPDAKALAQTDVAALRQLPGVKSVALVNQIPFGNSSWNSGIKLDPRQKESTANVTNYYGENLIETFGVHLVAGRSLTAGDFVEFADMVTPGSTVLPKVTVITSALAARLWPGESALGKRIFFDEDPITVVGVVDTLIRPSRREDAIMKLSMIIPVRMAGGLGANYVLRTTPAERDRTIAAAVAALKTIKSNRVVIRKRTFDEVRSDFFRGDRAMAGLLVGVCIALLIVTALGIVGLGSFWVAQRRRQIGVRRALGATRGNILHYFQTENFVLATIGIIVGMAMAYGINLFLMRQYELPRLPFLYLPVGALLLWLLGQLAVLGPALRAASVPPVVATRSA